MQRITDRTENLVREGAIRARVALEDVVHTLAVRARDQRGQISAEMMGLLFIVALIIYALVDLDVAGKIADAVEGFIDDITKGENPKG